MTKSVERFAGLRAPTAMFAFPQPGPARRPPVVSAAALCVLLWAAWPAQAAPEQPTPTPEGTQSPEQPSDVPQTSSDASPARDTAAPAQPASVLPVAVTLNGFELDESLVLAAISKELGVSTAAVAPGGSARLEVTATKGGDLVVRFTPESGAALLRAVTAPERDDEVPEASALLAGNLARDQASELIVGLTPAAAPPPPTRAEPTAKLAAPAADAGPELTSRLANLTLAYPLTIVRDTERVELRAELGLFYSRVGGLRGAALNGLVLQIDGPSQGAALAGAVGLYRGPATGAYVGGLANLYGESFSGVSFSGLATIVGGPERSFSASGLFTYNPHANEGVRIAGVANVSGNVSGAQIAGLGNVAGDSSGGQIAGLGNVAKETTGQQIAGLINISRSLEGLQLSSLANISAESVHGAQIGFLNYGGHVRGLQLGLVNIADDVDGASVGLVTYSSQGKVQPVLWYSGTSPMNVGVRFYTGPLYAMPTFGYSSKDDPKTAGSEAVDTYSVGLSLGGRIPIRRAFVDLDANYSNPMPEFRFDEHSIHLRYRALVGYSVTDWFGVFAGGGVLQRFRTTDYQGMSYVPELSAGIELL